MTVKLLPLLIWNEKKNIVCISIKYDIDENRSTLCVTA